MLPAPFDVLQVCLDKRRKGRRIITCVDDDWTLHVYLAPSGISILHYAYYFKSITSMIHIQCTNFQYSSAGYLSIGRYRKHRIHKRKQPTMFNLPNGLVADCFISLCQGYFFQGKDLMAVVHFMCPHKIKNNSISSMLEKYSTNASDFVNNVFQSQHTLVPAGDIEFIYMNQIAGPTHQEWRIEPSTFSHLGDVFVEMRLSPDSWTNKYMDCATSSLNLISMKTSDWCQDQGVVRLTKKQRKKCVVPKLNMQKSTWGQQQLFICRPIPRLLTPGTKWDCGDAVEYYQESNGSFKVFVELTNIQSSYLQEPC